MTEHTLQIFKPPHLLCSPLHNYLSHGISSDLSELCTRFPAGWSVYIMGGVLRNLLLKEFRGLPLRNADIDLVVNGANSRDELNDRLKGYFIRQNEFGGAKCRVSPRGEIFDVWRIEDHVGMSSIPGPHTIEQLLRHNLLDIDAILLDIQTETLYDYGCASAIQQGKISLLGPEGISNEFAAAQAAHIILVALKTGFELSGNVVRFVRDVCDRPQTKAEVLRVAQRKMPEAVERIQEFISELMTEEESWPMMTT